MVGADGRRLCVCTLPILIACGISLACGGVGAPPAPIPPIEPPPAPAPLPKPGLDRSKHDGLPEGVTNWELFTSVVEPTPAHMVIMWGSTSEDEAWEWLERYAEAGGTMRPEEGYPAVVASKWFKGLNPGFWLVVAAEPVDAAVAERVLDGLRAKVLPGVDLSGTYVREVDAYLPEKDLHPSSVLR